MERKKQVKTGVLSTIALTILSDNAVEIKHAIKVLLHQQTARYANISIDIVQCATSATEIDVDKVSVLLADPDLAACIIDKCHDLTWCQSTWAGNAPLLQLKKRDYALTGLKGVFGKLMREYVFAYLLQHARNINAFQANQLASPPKWQASSRLPLMGQTLGILGIGSIGQALIPVAKVFGMRVIGLSRSGTNIEGADRVYTPNQIADFAKDADHVVNLMPDTPQTQNMLSYSLFSQLKPHSIFINAGRGSAVDEEALIKCLDEDKLAHAVLDVFRQEPLPSAHAFWAHPKISITAHTAAESAPSDISEVFLNNALRYAANEPFNYEFNFEQGY